MYCPSLFIVVLQELPLFTTTFTFIIVVCSNTSMCIPSFILIGCCVSEIKGHLYLYHNVWPEAINFNVVLL